METAFAFPHSKNKPTEGNRKVESENRGYKSQDSQEVIEARGVDDNRTTHLTVPLHKIFHLFVRGQKQRYYVLFDRSENG